MRAPHLLHPVQSKTSCLDNLTRRQIAISPGRCPGRPAPPAASGCWPAPSRTRSGIANRRRTCCVTAARVTARPCSPYFKDLTSSDARAPLGLAPSPAAATTLRRPRLRAALARAGRRRNLDHQVERILAGLRAEQFRQPELIEQAIRQTARSRICARSMPRWPTSSSWRHGCFWHPTACTGAPTT